MTYFIKNRKKLTPDSIKQLKTQHSSRNKAVFGTKTLVQMEEEAEQKMGVVI